MYTKCVRGRGSAPDSAGGAYTPRWIRGGEGDKEEGELGKEGRAREQKEEEGREREERRGGKREEKEGKGKGKGMDPTKFREKLTPLHEISDSPHEVQQLMGVESVNYI